MVSLYSLMLQCIFSKNKCKLFSIHCAATTFRNTALFILFFIPCSSVYSLFYVFEECRMIICILRVSFVSSACCMGLWFLCVWISRSYVYFAIQGESLWLFYRAGRGCLQQCLDDSIFCKMEKIILCENLGMWVSIYRQCGQCV